MPIFDFSCRACGNTFELLVRKNEPACPKCGAVDLERLLSLPAIKSESTHGLAMRAAKKRDRAQGQERVTAQRHYEAHHDD
jgi:putative FmdB family regulatory protein